jgi:hypothetical protein
VNHLTFTCDATRNLTIVGGPADRSTTVRGMATLQLRTGSGGVKVVAITPPPKPSR